MRTLTSNELEQCAGGQVPPGNIVTVTGSRIYGSVHIAGYDGDNPDAQDDASNWGPHNQYYPDPEVEKEQLTDMAACALAKDIMAQPDWKEREYGAVIYINKDGELKSAGLARGETRAEAQQDGRNQAEIRIPPPADLEGGRIVAIIHNHPDIGFNEQEDMGNLRPSDRDWAGALNLVGNHIAETYDFAHYILGPDGGLREYEYLTHVTQGYQKETAAISTF